MLLQEHAFERVGGGKGDSTGRGERRDTPKTAERLRRDLLRPGLAVGTDGRHSPLSPADVRLPLVREALV